MIIQFYNLVNYIFFIKAPINNSPKGHDSKNSQSDNEINDPLPPTMKTEFKSYAFIKEITNIAFEGRSDLVKKIKVLAQNHKSGELEEKSQESEGKSSKIKEKSRETQAIENNSRNR